jgi:hypothetical protein
MELNTARCERALGEAREIVAAHGGDVARLTGIVYERLTLVAAMADDTRTPHTVRMACATIAMMRCGSCAWDFDARTVTPCPDHA